MRNVRIQLPLLLRHRFANARSDLRYHLVGLRRAEYAHEDLNAVVAELVVAQVQGVQAAEAQYEIF